MSFRAIKWAWQQEISSSEKLVLLALSDHANDRGFAWPSVRKISEKTGLSERTVQYQLRSLEESVLIQKATHSRKRTNVYRVLCPEIVHATAETAGPPRERKSASQSAVQEGTNGAAPAPQGCNSHRPEGAAAAPEPIKYTSYEGGRSSEAQRKSSSEGGSYSPAFKFFFYSHPCPDRMEWAWPHYQKAVAEVGGDKALFDIMRAYPFPKIGLLPVTKWLRDRMWDQR